MRNHYLARPVASFMSNRTRRSLKGLLLCGLYWHSHAWLIMMSSGRWDARLTNAHEDRHGGRTSGPNARRLLVPPARDFNNTDRTQ